MAFTWIWRCLTPCPGIHYSPLTATTVGPQHRWVLPMRRGWAAFSSDGLGAGHTCCHKMQGLRCSFLGTTCQDKHCGGAGTPCPSCYYSLSHPPQNLTYTLQWISENPLRRQSIREEKHTKGLGRSEPIWVLDWGLQVESCCHFTTHSGSACLLAEKTCPSHPRQVSGGRDQIGQMGNSRIFLGGGTVPRTTEN